MCDRCHWTGWYQNSRTVHTMRCARENQPAWALQIALNSRSLWPLVIPFLSTWKPPSLSRELGVWLVAASEKVWPGRDLRGLLVQPALVSDSNIGPQRKWVTYPRLHTLYMGKAELELSWSRAPGFSSLSHEVFSVLSAIQTQVRSCLSSQPLSGPPSVLRDVPPYILGK